MAGSSESSVYSQDAIFITLTLIVIANKLSPGIGILVLVTHEVNSNLIRPKELIVLAKQCLL